MSSLDQIRRLFRHLAWADQAMLAALQNVSRSDPAWREFSHILGAEAVWLGRLEQRAERTAIWPTLSRDEAVGLLDDLQRRYAAYLERLEPRDLELQIPYVNSAGNQFTTSIGDILLHVAMHGQYHRGKINLMLRQSGLEPAPVDYVAFMRGAPAARS